MTIPSEPNEPMSVDPAAGADHTDDDLAATAKAKATALLAGVTAIVDKVREEAPKKVQQILEKRAAGRCVILTEQDGRTVAVGPYADREAAQADSSKVGSDARVVELVPESAFFGEHV